MQNHRTLPLHIGIIMDGTTRWAHTKGLSPDQGYRECLEASRRIAGAASRTGISWLSLCMRHAVKDTAVPTGTNLPAGTPAIPPAYRDFLLARGMRLVLSGTGEGLPEPLRHELDCLATRTRQAPGLTVHIHAGRVDTPGITPSMPPLDLLIRTAGMQDTAGLEDWQKDCGEVHAARRAWPDWDALDLEAALRHWRGPSRRTADLSLEAPA